MSELKFKTIANTSPQGKSRVYFTCHPEDFERYFEDISDEILNMQNCAVYYYEPICRPSGLIADELSQMQLFVIPVTSELLYSSDTTVDEELKFAIEHHIPVLPIMQENNLDDLFNHRFGELHFLDKYAQGPTAISYDEKLSKFLDSILISDDLAEKIRAAFDAYIFLSYRKKDRKYAHELMRLIHQNSFCRDIAIWYDEFLIPGENFNDAIADAIQKSKLFALVVTPNLICEDNYVISTEYPMAKAQGIPVLPAESVKTDKTALRACFEGLPDCTDVNNQNALSTTLLDALGTLHIQSNDTSPEHMFFIGLAYLSGIDVEVNHQMALSLIESAAELGLPEAMKKLADMYLYGEGISGNYHTAISWQEKLMQYYENEYKVSCNRKDAVSFANAGTGLMLLYEEIDEYEKAIKTGEKILANEHIQNITEIVINRYAALGNIYIKIGKRTVGEEMLKEALEKIESMSRNHTEIYDILKTQCCGSLATMYFSDEQYDNASEMFSQALQSAEKLYDLKPDLYAFEIAKIYDNYATVCDCKGNCDKAHEMRTKAVCVFRKLCTEKPGIYETDLAIACNNAAVNCNKNNDLKNAEALYNEAMNIFENCDAFITLQAKNAQAECSENFAWMYAGQNKLKKAFNYIQKAIAIRESIVVNSSLLPSFELAKTYASAGRMYKTLNCIDEAKDYFEKSIDLFETGKFENFTTYEAELAAVYSEIGTVYNLLNEKLKSEEFVLKGFEIIKRVCSKNPGVFEMDLARHYIALGDVYFRCSKYTEALKQYEEAILTWENMNIPDAGEAELADLCCKAGMCCVLARIDDNALKYAHRAVEIAKNLCQKHPGRYEDKLISCITELALVYQSLGKIENAECEIRCAAITAQRLYNKSDYDAVAVYAKYCDRAVSILTEAEKYDEADLYSIKAIELWKSLAAKKVPDAIAKLASAYFERSAVNVALKEYPKADRLLQKAVETGEFVYKKDEGFGSELKRFYECYGQLCKNIGDTKRAAKLIQKAIWIEKQSKK